MNIRTRLAPSNFSCLAIFFACSLASSPASSTEYEFTTYSGSVGMAGSTDGPAVSARLNYPTDVAVDGAGNVIVLDDINHVIRKISPDGVVTTLAGSPGFYGSVDGTGSAAGFGYLGGVVVDGSGNVYVTDTVVADSDFPISSTIRKISPDGVVTTFAGAINTLGSADGTGSAARFSYPSGMAVDLAGNVFVADTDNFTIRKITPAGVVTTIAGLAGVRGSEDGTGSTARFYIPYGVAVDDAGNVFVADTYNHTIRKITPGGVVTTLAGVAGEIGTADGTGAAARFSHPSGIAVEQSGNLLVTGSYTIRRITAEGVVTTIAGATDSLGSRNGRGTFARFSDIGGLATDEAGNIYLADPSNHVIRKGMSVAALPSRLINLSCRALAGSGSDTLIMGFYLAGTGSKTVLIRGVGPELLNHGVPSVVADPRIDVYRDQTIVGSNNDWDPSLAIDFQMVGAFPLTPNSKDAAISITLDAPGAYTVHLVNDGPVAEALIEVYDNSHDTATRLANGSTRLHFNANQTVIMGAYQTGGSQSVLVRNSGPALSLLFPGTLPASIVLPDPHLTVFSGNNSIAENDDWNPTLEPVFNAAGAFGFGANSKDAAIRVPFSPGAYTVHASDVAGTPGVAIIEFYESP